MVLGRSLTRVDDLFAPPGTTWQPVSPALARPRHAVLLVSGVGFVVVVLVATLVFSLPWELWLPVVAVVAGLCG